ncbi:arginase [Aspergillus fumigatus]
MTAPSTIKQRFLSKPNELGVVAVGFNGGQCKLGVEAAPLALIEAGLLNQVRDDLGYQLHYDDTVHYYESLTPLSDPDHRGMKKPRAVSVVTETLSKQVYDYAKDGKFVLTLGGDHSIAIGTISGTAKAIRERLGREMAVIWVDAHADINTPEMSPSGNIHGMPMAFLTRLAREDKKDIFGWLQDEHIINKNKLVYIGLRDVDRGEKQLLREHGIKAFSMHDIDRHGIGRVVEMALAHIGNDTPIHLSFDVDALDPQWAPSTGTPVRGGLTLREGDFICECVHETGNLIAMDLVEVNPSLDEVGASETIRAGCSLRASTWDCGADALSPSIPQCVVRSVTVAVYRSIPPCIVTKSYLEYTTPHLPPTMAARVQRRRRYRWPELQLNIWIIIVLAGSAICLGIFAWFMAVQSQLRLGTPWLFPYMVVSGSLGVFFIFLVLFLAAQRFLLPGIIIIGSFILFVLWLTGLIETSLQLYGVVGNVNDNCQNYVVENPSTGNNINTLAWLTQSTICNCWKTAFAFELVNTIFFLWMMVMSWQVNRDVYD